MMSVSNSSIAKANSSLEAELLLGVVGFDTLILGRELAGCEGWEFSTDSEEWDAGSCWFDSDAGGGDFN